MSFARVLREAIERDEGVAVRLSTYQRMHAHSTASGGETAGFWNRIAARSRKITAAVAALWARRNEE